MLILDQQAWIASDAGVVYHLDMSTWRLRKAFEQPECETMMGLARSGETLYVGGKNFIYMMSVGDATLTEVCRTQDFHAEQPMFHQMDVIGERLYVAATGTNEVYEFDLDLKLVEKHPVHPPQPDKPVAYKSNYNHINNVFHYKGHFYVCCNWYMKCQHGPSGVAVFDEGWNERERFVYGWETHDFCILQGKRHCVFGSPAKRLGKRISHPHMAGMMVDGKPVFEHDPDECFCKALAFDGQHYYLGGGGLAERSERRFVDGYLFVLDPGYNELHRLVCAGSGQFLGVLVDGDLTKANGDG